MGDDSCGFVELGWGIEVSICFPLSFINHSKKGDSSLQWILHGVDEWTKVVVDDLDEWIDVLVDGEEWFHCPGLGNIKPITPIKVWSRFSFQPSLFSMGGA